MRNEERMVGYFAYGSLVNELTWRRSYSACDAVLLNWSREWNHCVDTPWGRICALTASPRPGKNLQGILIFCPQEELDHVDEREIGYFRQPISPSDVLPSLDRPPTQLFLYASRDEYRKSGSLEYPLWRSYVECVLCGYLRRFGEIGVDQFISSTSGWSAPLLDDRQTPRYPRTHPIPPDHQRFITKRLKAIDGINFFKPDTSD